MVHRLPTDKDIRDRIDSIKDDQTRMAFRYQYLTAGRISEVCGRYAPRGDDCYVVDLDGGDLAVLFVVKTAKRGGQLRPVALPLRADYEPWADEVRQYMAYHRGEYPFRFHENWETSKTYGMKRATQALRGLEWPMIDYTRSETKPVMEEQILNMRFDDKGREMYLLAEADGSRKWYAKAEDGHVKYGVKIPSRWKHATSHVFRKRRTVTLTLEYGFDPIDLAWVGGWTEHSQAANLPVAVKHYLYMDIQEAKEALTILKKMARRYYSKLLKPYGGA